MMSDLPTTSPESSRETMSALADGQADPASATAMWARDAQAREAWHTYHLIGDVLRSDDLAVPAKRDADFLESLRRRLADEPPILAPSSMAAPAAAVLQVRRRWAAPIAAAAGFAAVAAVVVMTRAIGSGGDAAPVVAAAPAATGLSSGQVAAPGVVGGGTAVVQGEPQFQVVDGKLIRDARLDGYLRAHRGGSAAVPGSAVGRFETVVLER
jgi:sigma-E factor negative regulatory protein RseA